MDQDDVWNILATNFLALKSSTILHLSDVTVDNDCDNLMGLGVTKEGKYLNVDGIPRPMDEGKCHEDEGDEFWEEVLAFRNIFDVAHRDSRAESGLFFFDPILPASGPISTASSTFTRSFSPPSHPSKYTPNHTITLLPPGRDELDKMIDCYELG